MGTVQKLLVYVTVLISVRQILTADNLISEVPVHLQWDKLPTGLN
jgi:hypothetical protein